MDDQDKRATLTLPLKPSGTLTEPCGWEDFTKAVQVLLHLNPTVRLNESQTVAWFGVLRIFPAWVVSRAMMGTCLSECRWPQIGDVYQECRQIMSRAGQLPREWIRGECRKYTNAEILAVGQSLGLDVGK